MSEASYYDYSQEEREKEQNENLFFSEYQQNAKISTKTVVVVLKFLSKNYEEEKRYESIKDEARDCLIDRL